MTPIDLALLTPLEKREWLKASLRVKKTSFARISRDLGVSASAVSMVSASQFRSVIIEEAIASALGIDPKLLWSDPDKEPKINRE